MTALMRALLMTASAPAPSPTTGPRAEVVWLGQSAFMITTPGQPMSF